jgi:predicted nucleic acid-binding protein
VILADATVVIAFLRGERPDIEQVLRSEPVAIAGVTRAEVLHGARDVRDVARLVEALNRFRRVATQEDVWTDLGHNLRRLRAAGLPMPFQDVLLATIAVYHAVPVWAYDAHYRMIRQVIPELRLFGGAGGVA